MKFNWNYFALATWIMILFYCLACRLDIRPWSSEKMEEYFGVTLVIQALLSVRRRTK